MASLDAIRDALAATITDGVASTLFCYSSAADLAELPAIIIEPTAADFTESFARGTDCWDFNVYVICSRVDSEVGQSQLDGFVTGAGPNSIRQVLFNNPSIGLSDGTDAMVHKMTGYGGTFQDASIQLVGAILKVRVITDGRA